MPGTRGGLAAALAGAAVRLAAAGVGSPDADARALAAHVLGTGPGRLVLVEDFPDGSTRDAFDRLVDRRAAREPLQHLTGRAAFRRLELAVGPGVFVPRPETEVLAGWCLEVLPAGGRVLDLCAGSGAIALSVADERADAEVWAVEREPAAYAWLARNCAGSPVRPVLADAAAALPELDGTVDLVVSNPPYIPDDGIPLEPEVARYDPPAALWSGADGLDTVRAVAARAAALLRPGGRLAVEHADRQGAEVIGLLAAAGWLDVRDHRDLTGRDRFATARRAG